MRFLTLSDPPLEIATPSGTFRAHAGTMRQVMRLEAWAAQQQKPSRLAAPDQRWAELCGTELGKRAADLYARLQFEHDKENGRTPWPPDAGTMEFMRLVSRSEEGTRLLLKLAFGREHPDLDDAALDGVADAITWVQFNQVLNRFFGIDSGAEPSADGEGDAPNPGGPPVA